MKSKECQSTDIEMESSPKIKRNKRIIIFFSIFFIIFSVLTFLFSLIYALIGFPVFIFLVLIIFVIFLASGYFKNIITKCNTVLKKIVEIIISEKTELYKRIIIGFVMVFMVCMTSLSIFSFFAFFFIFSIKSIIEHFTLIYLIPMAFSFLISLGISLRYGIYYSLDFRNTMSNSKKEVIITCKKCKSTEIEKKGIEKIKERKQVVKFIVSIFISIFLVYCVSLTWLITIFSCDDRLFMLPITLFIISVITFIRAFYCILNFRTTGTYHCKICNNIFKKKEQ